MTSKMGTTLLLLLSRAARRRCRSVGSRWIHLWNQEMLIPRIVQRQLSRPGRVCKEGSWMVARWRSVALPFAADRAEGHITD